MRHDLTDIDVLTFALAGCNAAEVAEFAGISRTAAQSRLNRALLLHSRGLTYDDLPTPDRSPEWTTPTDS